MKELESKSKKKKNGNNDSDGGNEPQFLKGAGHRKRQEEKEKLERRNKMLDENLATVMKESNKFNLDVYFPKVDKSKESFNDDKDDVGFDF